MNISVVYIILYEAISYSMMRDGLLVLYPHP